MLLGEFSMICFDFLSYFWRKSQNEQGGKTRQKSGLHHSEGHLCRGEVLHRSEGCLATARSRGQKRPPLGFAKA